MTPKQRWEQLRHDMVSERYEYRMSNFENGMSNAIRKIMLLLVCWAPVLYVHKELRVPCATILGGILALAFVWNLGRLLGTQFEAAWESLRFAKQNRANGKTKLLAFLFPNSLMQHWLMERVEREWRESHPDAVE